ncbi:MAG TPA: IS30 family transposase [Coriobacteriia bacterium]|nr:IS30 family transposase [Coriobacteriia bacterium]
MPENARGYRHFTFDERCEIQRLLNAGESVSSIALSLAKSVSSVTREIKRNRRDDGYRSTPTSIMRLCVHYKTCTIKALCRMCSTRRCASCKKVRCTNICPNFTADVCGRNGAAPFVCNGCASVNGCRLHRYRYDAKLAQRLADSRLVDSRTGIDTTSEAFGSMIATAKPLIKEKGQSIAHVWAAHRGEFPCSERTFYRYVDLGLGGMKNLDLVAKCRYRPRKRARPAERFFVPEGRTFNDYCALSEEERLSAVEIDCVEGVRTDTKVLLTMLHKRTSFLFVFLLEEHTQACVGEVFDTIGSILCGRFSAVFPLILSDRGHEFANFESIEKDGRTCVYYCDPRRADQKGSVENRHRLLRRIAPKGTSIDGFTRRDASILTSHVNSMPRASLGGASPFDLAHHVLPTDLLEGLGLEHIAPDDVVLKPSLLTGDNPK